MTLNYTKIKFLHKNLPYAKMLIKNEHELFRFEIIHA